MNGASRFFAWLRKPVAGGQLVPQMEGLRFAALWAVFFLHFNQSVITPLAPDAQEAAMSTLLSRVCGVGDFGVQLFFAISGFVLALPFARWRLLGGKPVALKRYFLRRLVRLEPPLFINLIIMIPLAVWVFHKLPLADVPRTFAWTMGYGHRLFLGDNSPLNRVTWSLETEAQFYLAMPLLGCVFLIGNRTLRRALLIALALVCVPFKTSMNKAFLLAQIEYFALGLLLADLYLTNWRDGLGKSRAWDVAGLAGWCAMLSVLLTCDHEAFGTAAALPVCVFLAFGAALRGRMWHRVWSLPSVTLIGGMCYTFYLYHDPLVKLTAGTLRRVMPAQSYGAQFTTWFVIVASVTLGVSVILYALFERPFMSRRGVKSSAEPVAQPADRDNLTPTI